MQGISVSELWDRSTVAGSVAELYIRGIGMLMFTWWGIIAPLFINPFSYRSIWIVSPNVGMIFVLSFFGSCDVVVGRLPGGLGRNAVSCLRFGLIQGSKRRRSYGVAHVQGIRDRARGPEHGDRGRDDRDRDHRPQAPEVHRGAGVLGAAEGIAGGPLLAVSEAVSGL